MIIVKRITIFTIILAYLCWSPIAFANDLILSNSTTDQPADAESALIGPDKNVGPIAETGVLNDTITDEATNQINLETGSDSSNTNETSQNNQAKVNDVDSSTVQNSVNADLISGKNNINKNSKVDGTTTGGIQGSINIINVSGSNFAAGSSVGVSTVDGSKSSEIIIPTEGILFRTLLPKNSSNNNTTGAGSNNSNIADTKNAVSFITNNSSLRLNNLNINADSGQNLISKNTLVGDITTGDIDLGVNIINLKNFVDPSVLLSIDIWSIENGLNGDIILPNNNIATGAASSNNNLMNKQGNTDIGINDSSNINNIFDLQTNTGENTLLQNSSVGRISTGTSKIAGGIVNQETPVFYLINVFGKFTGKVIGIDGQNYLINQISAENLQSQNSNILTGVSSDNQNIANIQQNKEIMINDSSTTSNKIRIAANTGRNIISENTIVKNITTGSVNLIANAVNLIGDTISALNLKNVKLRVINIFGDWNGNLTLVDQSNLTKEISKSDTPVLSGSNTISQPKKPMPDQNSVLGTVYRGSKENQTQLLSGELPNSGIQRVEAINTFDDEEQNNKRNLGIVVIPSIILALSISIEMLSRLRAK